MGCSQRRRTIHEEKQKDPELSDPIVIKGATLEASEDKINSLLKSH